MGQLCQKILAAHPATLLGNGPSAAAAWTELTICNALESRIITQSSASAQLHATAHRFPLTLGQHVALIRPLLCPHARPPLCPPVLLHPSPCCCCCLLPVCLTRSMVPLPTPLSALTAFRLDSDTFSGNSVRDCQQVKRGGGGCSVVDVYLVHKGKR